VWVARAGSRDFRQAAWKETTAVIEENQVQISVAPSATEVTALFGEVDFEIDGLVHQFSTQMRILDKQP
jgi:PhoPQ-activated pathogenicity-related protein